MSTFIQLHLLTSYPPSNLNRDDLGRPKTAIMGNATRLRISSQSLKRAWRKSEIIKLQFNGAIGDRTKKVGAKLMADIFKGEGIPIATALEWLMDLMRVYGEPDYKESDLIKTTPDDFDVFVSKQLVHISPLEENLLAEFTSNLCDILNKKVEPDDQLKELIELQDQRNKKKKDDEKKKVTNKITEKLREYLLRAKNGAVDIAMFGRMLASAPKFNMEAAVQVAHAVTVHEVTVEDDFFTAVDDLNEGAVDMGAGHMGETEFGAGLYYIYVCINKDLLKTNLNGDTALADNACKALVQSAATISPTGKQNSFGSRAYATYVLAEKGSQQPRSLSVAFLSPIKSKNLGEDAVTKLEEARDKITKVYGKCFDEEARMNALSGDGSLSDILKFVEG